MITVNLTCVGFMDSDPAPDNSVRVELAVTPRFFIPPPTRPAEPDRRDADLSFYADYGQSIKLTASAVTDPRGRVQVRFDAADAWLQVGRRTHPTLGRARDVVGMVTTRVNIASMDLFSGHRVVLARSPQATVDATVIVDPAKVIIGRTTAVTARVLCWLHAATHPDFRFTLLRRGGGADDYRGIPIPNGSVKVTTIAYRDLTPDTTYTVSLIAQSLTTLVEQELACGQFRTRPRVPRKWTVDFASCHLPTSTTSLRPWTLQANREPADLLLLLGDQIYGDAVPDLTPSSLSWLRRYALRYEQLWAYRPMRQVLRRTPTVAIFDDHEVVDDWGVASVNEIGSDRLDGALAAYDRFQGSLNPPGRPAGQFDFGFADGRLAVYALDERSQRGTGAANNVEGSIAGASDNVLGSEQLRRFRRWCRSPEALDADVVLLASSVPLAYLPTAQLEDLAGEAAVGIGTLLGATVGVIVAGPAGAVVGGLVGAAGAAIIYDEKTEDIRDPDLQDQWVHERNQAGLSSLLDELFDLAADLHGDPPGRRPRAVFVLSGDVHVGGVHLIRSDRTRDGHDHRRNRLIYQLTSSPVSHDPPDSAPLRAIVNSIGTEVDLRGAEFLTEHPDRTGGLIGTGRFVLDSELDGFYAAEYLGALHDQNVGRLVVENLGGRRYRFQSSIDGRTDSLVTMFDLDLDASPVRPMDLIGQVLQQEGTPTQLRVNDVGGGFGPPSDHLDAEVVVMLDTAPGRAFGLQLRDDAAGPGHRGMFDRLRDAFNRSERVRLDYLRTGPRNGTVIRVITTDANRA